MDEVTSKARHHSDVEKSHELCTICQEEIKLPSGKPDVCDHIFCFTCLTEWLKKNSKCPLCMQSVGYVMKISGGERRLMIKVKARSAAEYETEINAVEEMESEYMNVPDITLEYAQCRVCHKSDNEDRLLLCDGIVGHELDGSEINCNVAYHTYCLTEKLESLPQGNWYCPFCVGSRENRPSRSNMTNSLRSRNRIRSRLQSFEGRRRGRPFTSHRTSRRHTESDTESEDDLSDGEDSLNEENWSEIDNYVLDDDDQPGPSASGRTVVRHRKSSKRRRKRRKKPHSLRSNVRRGTTRRTKKTARKNDDPKSKKKRKQRGNSSRTDRTSNHKHKKSHRNRCRKIDCPGVSSVFSLFRDDFDDIPVDDALLHNQQQLGEPGHSIDSGRVQTEDIVGIIMDEQKVALARGCSQKISSDGKLQFVDPNVASAHDVGGDSSLTIPKKSEAMGEVSSDSARVTKLRRPTRWGTPTNSSAATIPSSIKTASIPLPVGPPAHMPRLSSEVIPRHNSLQPNTTKKKFPQPSALNTSPSTSYSLNAFAPPLGSSQPGLTSLTNQSLTSLSTQANLSLPQLSTALSHQQVLQLQPNLLPSFAVVQPPFGFGVSNLLAAGLFGNGPLGPPISQPASMFLGNLPVGNQNQITTVPGFSSLQQSSLLQNSQIPVGGVPPPPPAVRVNETVAPISESLAVKIRQLAEATGVKTFDNCLKDDKKVEMDSKNSESGRKSGKSASAEDEEASETDRKLHKNGPNFELARVMLSRSLKKVYKRKQITKEEYKEIMKKGVTALSQRSKLDPVKVEEYAKKYVECIVHRRKKKH